MTIYGNDETYENRWNSVGLNQAAIVKITTGSEEETVTSINAYAFCLSSNKDLKFVIWNEDYSVKDVLGTETVTYGAWGVGNWITSTVTGVTLAAETSYYIGCIAKPGGISVNISPDSLPAGEYGSDDNDFDNPTSLSPWGNYEHSIYIETAAEEPPASGIGTDTRGKLLGYTGIGSGTWQNIVNRHDDHGDDNNFSYTFERTLRSPTNSIVTSGLARVRTYGSGTSLDSKMIICDENGSIVTDGISGIVPINHLDWRWRTYSFNPAVQISEGEYYYLCLIIEVDSIHYASVSAIGFPEENENGGWDLLGNGTFESPTGFDIGDIDISKTDLSIYINHTPGEVETLPLKLDGVSPGKIEGVSWTSVKKVENVS